MKHEFFERVALHSLFPAIFSTTVLAVALPIGGFRAGERLLMLFFSTGSHSLALCMLIIVSRSHGETIINMHNAKL